MTTSSIRRIAAGMTEIRRVDFEATPAAGDGRTLEGLAAVFNSPTRIRDLQGDFDETILPGAFARSIAARMPVLQFDHGKDPRVGSVPIGAIEVLRETESGLYVRARLFDNPVVEPVRQAIAGKAIRGMSFRFNVPEGGDRWGRGAGGVDTREVRDADVHELGPVVFPAYDATTVSVRSGEGGSGLVTEDCAERIVDAYALRWGTVSEGVNGRWYRLRPGCVDDWLAGEPTGVPILVGHGLKFDSDERSTILDEPVGEVFRFEADRIGLLTAGYYYPTFLGDATLGAIDDDVLRSYSVRLRVRETVESDERGPDGRPVLDVVRAEVVECGPTDDPVDPGAVVVRVGGRKVRDAERSADDRRPARASGLGSMDDALDLFAAVTGEDLTLDDAAARRRDTERAAEQQLRDAEWVARQLAKTRQQIERTYEMYRSQWGRPDDFDEMRELEARAEELDADLRDLLCHDAAMYSEVAARAGVGPKITPLTRIRALAAPRGSVADIVDQWQQHYLDLAEAGASHAAPWPPSASAVEASMLAQLAEINGLKVI